LYNLVNIATELKNLNLKTASRWSLIQQNYPNDPIHYNKPNSQTFHKRERVDSKHVSLLPQFAQLKYKITTTKN